MVRHHQATERQSLEQVRVRLSEVQAHVGKILLRLKRICPLGDEITLVDVGAAQGLLLIACATQGIRAVGVEPWQQARRVAEDLAKALGVEIEIRPGLAEDLPLCTERFDVVHALSVIEHVGDVQVAFNEAYRVLKPGGVFWFHTASSVCPRQFEIGLFPLFGWYPDRLKRRIMNWAIAHRPHLVGHTKTPALHWFTPRKARQMLVEVGFTKVYDRWDLRLPTEGGRLHAAALRIVRLCAATRFIANVLTPSCSYAAVK